MSSARRRAVAGRPVTYASQPTVLHPAPRPVTNAEPVWVVTVPVRRLRQDAADNRDSATEASRSMSRPSTPRRRPLPAPTAVGVFDPDRLEPFNALTRVPLGGLRTAAGPPAGDRSQPALNGRDLLPDSNLAGYLGQPPQLVTTLSALPALENSTGVLRQPRPGRPISAIRIRVAGDHVQNALGRARVNLVAQDIIERDRVCRSTSWRGRRPRPV